MGCKAMPELVRSDYFFNACPFCSAGNNLLGVPHSQGSALLVPEKKPRRIILGFQVAPNLHLKGFREQSSPVLLSFTLLDSTDSFIKIKILNLKVNALTNP